MHQQIRQRRKLSDVAVANEACDAGRVLIGGKPARASAEVKPGDEITILFGNKETKVKVLKVEDAVRKEDTADMFEYL